MSNHLPADAQVRASYELAKERYGALGVDTHRALERLSEIAVSMQCWQGDDVRGFEAAQRALSGGIATTGGYPGRARTADELRQDLDLAYSLIPGKHRLALHAIYAETGGNAVERNELQPEHFAGWVDWARERDVGLDFNPTLFSHSLADSGFTLSSRDAGVRHFWTEHCVACRRVGESFGRALGTPCVTNVWIPDGYKDIPVDRKAPRQRLKDSLDTVFAEEIDARYNLDAVEGKLFGLGSEAYVVGSHEFYLSYALHKGVLLTLDSGHFHPTEVISDKLSAILLFLDEIALHISRGVRWDSDHAVILSDELRAIMQEIVRGDFLGRVHVGLDYFDASVNRVAAWVIGMRATLQALLLALLEPVDRLRMLEDQGDHTGRLALMEALKMLPAAAVWDMYCLLQSVPLGFSFMDEIRRYERRVLSQRD